MEPWIFSTPPPPADLRLAYGRDGSQFGELRLPSNPPNPSTGGRGTPLVMVIHGGFWLSQFNLDHLGHVCARLASRGVATWNVEFRRLGNWGGGFPRTFHDVAAAADRLRPLAEEHGLDLSRLTVLGHSAGGQLALWLAARGRLSAGQSLFSERPLPVSRVVALAPVADLAAAATRGLGKGAVEHLMAGSPEAVADRYAEACARRLLPLGVPQVIFHGERDRWVPVELSRGYASVATAEGDSVRLREIPDVGHFELIDPEHEAWRLVEAEVLEGLIPSGG